MTLDILVRMNSIGYAISPESDHQQVRGSRAFFPKLFALSKPGIRGAVIGAAVGYVFNLVGDGTYILDGAAFGAWFSEGFFIFSQAQYNR